MDYLKDAMQKIYNHQQLFNNVSHDAPVHLIELANSYDGHNREYAVRQMRTVYNASFIPILLTRLNDWVPQVQQQAQQAVLEIANKNSKDLINFLSEIYHLKNCYRYNHNELIKNIISILGKAENITYFIHEIEGSNQRKSYIAFNICFDFGLIPKVDLLNIAISSKNPILYQKAMQIIESMNPEDSITVLPPLITHKFNRLRKSAITILNSLKPEIIKANAKQLIYDTNPDIRKIAKNYISSHQQDFIPVFKALLNKQAASVPQKSIALVELSELTGKDFLSDLQIYIDSGPIKLRKIALQQTSKILGDAAKPLIIQCIKDLEAAISNEGLKLYYDLGLSLDIDEMIDLCQIIPIKNRINAIRRLAKRSGKWEKLIILMRLLILNKTCTEIVDKINTEIHMWNNMFNLGSNYANKQQIREISDNLPLLESLLTKDNHQNLKFTLQTYNP